MVLNRPGIQMSVKAGVVQFGLLASVPTLDLAQQPFVTNFIENFDLSLFGDYER